MSLTRPLTRPLTRALSHSELTQKLGGGFSIFALNPFLLFDARDSMIGTLENPTLDLNPALPETLDVITATRAGTATFTDANGNIASASPNTVRVDYVDSVPMILVEPSATNLLTATQEVSSWSSTNVSVTSNTTTAPDGSQTGDTVTRTAGGADVRQTKAVTSGTSYTISIFAKAETDNEISLDLSDSRMGPDKVEFNTRTGQKVSGSNNYTITELSNGWRRYSFTSTCISSGNTGVIIRIENDEPVQLWGFQFEEGSVPTSHIPHISGSTVTRAADDLVISGSAFSSFFNATQGTVYAEFLYDHDEISKYLYSISQDGSNEIRCQNRVGSLRTRYTVNNSHVASLENNGILKGSLNRAAFSYKTNNFRANLNGGSDDEELSATASLNQVKLSIGSRSGTAQLNGHIKRLIYWPYHSDSL